MAAPEFASASDQLDAVMKIGLAGLFFIFIKAALLIGPGHRMLTALVATNKNLVASQVHRIVSQAASRIVGSVHNAIQIPFALFLLSDELIQRDHIYAITPLSKICMSITAGYFLVDLFICIWKYQEEGPLYLMHASLAFALFAHGVLNNINHFYGAAFLMWEISTPFVHLRWLLYKMGMSDTRIYIINGLLMMLTFFGCRCVWGTWISYDFWMVTMKEMANPRGGFPILATYFYRFANICLSMLNFYWFGKMVQNAMAVVSGRYTPPKDVSLKGE